jgi:DNA-nicking Smr family endonuclease
VIKKKYLSKEDKKVWENYIKNPSDIFDKDKSNLKKVKNQRFKFDLHGFTLDEANKKVKEIILNCVEKKYKEILLITGKGMHSSNVKDTYVSKDLGKLKFSVPNFIKTDEELSKLTLSISNADLKDGGEGAIIIRLRNL